MKNNLFYKIFASIIVIALILSNVINTNVYAVSSYTITITKKEAGHEYEAYQIFKGDLYDEKNVPESERTDPKSRTKTLSNIEWGSGVNDKDGLLNELKTNDILKTIFTEETTTAKQVAVILEGLEEDSTQLKVFAEIINKHLTSTSAASTENDDNYTIQVNDAGYYFIKDKNSSLDESEYSAYTRYMLKVVSDITVEPKSEKPSVKKSLSETENKAVDDHAINEKFDYYLTATLSPNIEYSEYEEYKLIFEDTVETGITYDEIESVIIKDAKESNDNAITEFTLTKDTDYTDVVKNLNRTITVNDLVNILETKHADITKGLKVVVKYKAHLNENAKISKKDSSENSPNVNTVKLKYSNDPNLNNEESMGTTVEDKAYVFTYGVDNTKYSKYATKDVNEGVLEGAGFKIYKKGESNDIKLKWDDNLKAYRPVGTEEEADDMMRSQKDGQFNIVGLDSGSYILKEEDTPEGYNTCDPIEIVITTSLEETEGSAQVTFTVAEHVKNDIINVHGSKLPSTGSIALIVITGVAIVLGITGIILSKNKKKE